MIVSLPDCGRHRGWHGWARAEFVVVWCQLFRVQSSTMSAVALTTGAVTVSCHEYLRFKQICHSLETKCSFRLLKKFLKGYSANLYSMIQGISDLKAMKWRLQNVMHSIENSEHGEQLDCFCLQIKVHCHRINYF